MTQKYQVRSTCRLCEGKDLYQVLSLGEIVPSTFPLPNEPDPAAVPMTVVRCDQCGFVQLRESLDDAELYGQYWYISGTNETMRAELADVVKEIRSYLPAAPCTVLDIGANDGTLLSNYPPSVRKIAFEPACNLIERLSKQADMTYPTFFPSRASYNLAGRSIRAISACAMFYDLEDPRAFVQEIDRLLTDDGVWVVQMQDLAQQVETNAFDNFCFEHRGYYSLQTFQQTLEGTDLHVIHAERRAINGGSLRIAVRRTHFSPKPTVDALLKLEAPWTSPRALELFTWRVQEVKRMVTELVVSAKELYGVVDMYACSTKSSTLLQYCGIDHRLIRQAAERTPEKYGRVTAGTRIPIVSELVWRADPAPVCLVGSYQFIEAFRIREAAYLQGGGRFIVPLPTAVVLSEATRVPA